MNLCGSLKSHVLEISAYIFIHGSSIDGFHTT